MRIVVTGGSGFIGTNIVEHFRREHTVLNLDTATPRASEHAGLWRRVDILDRSALVSTLGEFQPDVVYHMAARIDLFGKSVSEYPANTLGVANMIEALRGCKSLRAAVFASSMLVCRIGYQPKSEEDYQPSTPYGESKIEGERLVRRSAGDNIPWVIVRPTSIWGPWFDAPYRDFFVAIQKNRYMHPRGRRIRRSYGFVANSVWQLDRLVSKGSSLFGRSIYLADHQPLELRQWADSIQRTLGSKPIREVPLWALRSAALGGDVLKKLGYKMPPMSSFRLNNLLTDMVHDTTPLQNLCGELPYSMEKGVTITGDWLQASGR